MAEAPPISVVPNAPPTQPVAIGDAVANRQASMEGSAYRHRLSYMESGDEHIPVDNLTQDIGRELQFTRAADGTTHVYMPALASGDRAYFTGGGYGNEVEASEHEWNQISRDDARHDMKKAIYFWHRDPLVFRCTRLLVQMSNTPLRIECENEEFGKLVSNWLDQAMPFTFKEQAFLEFYRTHFVPILKSLVPYTPRDFRDNKAPALDGGNVEAPVGMATLEARNAAARQSRADELVSGNLRRLQTYREAWGRLNVASEQFNNGLCSEARLQIVQREAYAAQYEWTKGLIPGGYTILDPLKISIEGPANMSWLRMPYLQIDGQLADAIRRPTPEQISIVDAMPVEIVTKIRAGENKVWLSPNVFDLITGDKMPYEIYPTPIARHCFDALEIKGNMLLMDKTTVKSVRNRVLLVKIGTDKFPEMDPRKIQKIKSLLQTPGNNLQLFWNHAISMEWIEPKLDSLLDEHKYDNWDDQIRTTYGISKVLTGTSESAGAIGNSIMNFKGLQQEIQSAQQKMLEFIHRQINLLRAALQVKWDVTCTFDTLNLQDPVKFIALLNAAVQQGIIDHQTAIETMGYHFPTILARMKKIKAFQDKGLFLAMPSANNLGPGGQKIGGGGGTPTKGKPANQPLADNNSNKIGKSQPKMKAAAVAVQHPKRPGKWIMVVDSDVVAPEAKQDVSQMFGCATDEIFSRAEYQTAFGSAVQFWQPWPELDMGETMAAIHEGDVLYGRVGDVIKSREAAHRSSASSKRGRYVSTEMRAQFMAEAFAQEVATFVGSKLEGLTADEVAHRVDDACETIAQSPVATSKTPEEVRAIATAFVVRRYQKFVTARAAESAPTPESAQ